METDAALAARYPTMSTAKAEPAAAPQTAESAALAAMYPTMAQKPVRSTVGLDEAQKQLQTRYPTMNVKTEAPKAPPPDPSLVALYPTMFADDAKAAQVKAPQNAKPAADGPPRGPSEARKPAAPANADVQALELRLPPEYVEGPELGEFRKTAGEWGLDSTKAQQLLDMHLAALASERKAQAARVESWGQATRLDHEVGGPRLGESVEFARRLVTEFGGPALFDLLNETGVGNHVEMVRLLSRVGFALENARSWK